MAFMDCLKEALRGGALQFEEFDRLKNAYAEEAANAAKRGDPDPAASAKAAVEKQWTDAEKHALRRKQLMVETIDRLAEGVTNYRDKAGRGHAAEFFEAVLENRNNVLAGVPSVVGRREALIADAHGQLEQLLHETRRTWLSGQRRGDMRLENVAIEAFEGGTGDAKAADFYRSYKATIDTLVDAFNAGGGSIAKREKYFPQRHVPEALLVAGKDKWLADIKPHLDLAAMKDPLTGGALTPQRLDEALGVIWQRAITDGAIDAAPTTRPQGRGALATQRTEERFIEFKSGRAWLDYHRAYGGDDIYSVMMDHVHGLARDVATLEILGPNPEATINWMSSVIRQEKARHDVGQPSLYRPRTAQMLQSDPAAFLNAQWQVVDGNLTNPNRGAAIVGGVRNWLTAANLGATALTAVAGDPAQATWARQFAGVPAFRFYADMVGQIFSSASKREISRAGIIIGDAMDHLRTDVGGYGLTAASNELSRWLPDRVFAWTGLTGWTNAARRAHAQAFMFHAGDLSGKTLADMANGSAMDAKFARWLQGFGIDEASWARIAASKAADLDYGEAGAMIRPMDVMNAGHREDALRYSEAIHALMEEATPSGTARARTRLGMDAMKGTMSGEVVRSTGMYLSYPTTVLISLKNALAHEVAESPGRGIGFAIKTLLTLSLGGAAILQLQQLRNGRDTRGVDSAQFWAEAVAKGGGFGFYGDWLMADYKRGGGEQAARLAGPVVGLGADILAVINPKAALGEDDETNRAERAVQLARRNTPVVSMWPIKPFADRILFDRLQRAANPDAHDAWRRTERRLEKEMDQGTWWRRGETLPHRAPDLSLW